jgi:hypothetical protein
MKSIAKYEAFRDIIESGRLGSIQLVIYNELLKNPQTIEHFRDALAMPHQTCTGAISMLEDTGFIYKYKTVISNKRKFTLYNAEVDFLKARDRAIDIEIIKRQIWINKGIRMGWMDIDTITHLTPLNLDI